MTNCLEHAGESTTGTHAPVTSRDELTTPTCVHSIALDLSKPSHATGYYFVFKDGAWSEDSILLSDYYASVK